MFPFFGRRPKRPKAKTKTPKRLFTIERLEDRSVLSSYSVVNLNDHGAGSLRQAILDADSVHGADVINFNVTGTIKLTTGPLPPIIDTVNIDGRTAPGFVVTPKVEIDFNHFSGLQFIPGTSGSALRSLSLVDAADNGVTLNGGGGTLIAGNFIGLALDGTPAGNGVNGLALYASSGNTIGGTSAEARNVISANRFNGIDLIAASNNDILGNYIGTDVTGTIDRGNKMAGIMMTAGSNNIIGGAQGNLISGNDGNGIGLYTASNNQISMNSIGTDVTGTIGLGNAGNGILLTNGSARNMIGGEATGGNDPTNGVFVRPPEGNLISANSGDGVLINNAAMQNQLSGNFIGTRASGNSSLGNSLDGVAIVNANSNSLIGCTFQQDPFVFYNVISGNGANGLRVTNSNDTTIQANFFGLGADNRTGLGNTLNGVLVEGSSTRTTMGGPIPLGNVDAANLQNGIVVQGTASFFTTYNTFTGLAAFSVDPTLGNHKDGMLITSTGGNILIRTCVVTENGNDGIEISGAARDVRVAGNIIGLNTNGLLPMGNRNNGVEVGGTAQNIVIGGPQPTFNIIPRNAIASNGNNGVAIVGTANNITVSHSYIGTDITGAAARGNTHDGVLLGPGTYSNTIGSTDPSLLTVISGNLSNGIEMRGTHNNTVIGSYIGTEVDGSSALGNGANGVYITSNSNDNLVGSTSAGTPHNVIAFNSANGVFVESGVRNGIRGNSIYGNVLLGIDLAAGANNNQAAPVLTSVHAVAGGIQVSCALTSAANTTFTIEFFATETSGPSGRYFLGSLKVTTNKNGLATFTFQGPLPPAGANFITATATDPINNTSEFSTPVS
jgi:hypothetical protein